MGGNIRQVNEMYSHHAKITRRSRADISDLRLSPARIGDHSDTRATTSINDRLHACPRLACDGGLKMHATIST